MHEQRSSLHELGMAVISEIGNEGFDSLSSALDSLDPDFKRLLVEGAYAEIIGRPNLSLERRELVTVAVLTTMGNAKSALKYHAGGMLNTGWSPEALLGTMWQTLLYGGVPVAIAGIGVALELFAERGITVAYADRVASGSRTDVSRLLFREHQYLESLPEEMQALIADVAYGTALSESALTVRDRELATLAIVMALPNQHPAVRQHLKVCRRLGWTRKELTEVLIQLTGYIGWPLVLPLTRIALDVFAQPTEDDSSCESSLIESVGRHMPGESPELSVFAVPEYVADMSPLVGRYLADIGAPKAQVEPPERARRQCLTDIACLTCLSRGTDTEILSMHVRRALTLGVSEREIADAMMRALPHAGLLSVQSGLLVVNRVVKEVVDVHSLLRPPDGAACPR